MSRRKPAVLRDRDEGLREHLIATAARLLAERGGAGVAVRDIARQAKVADGVLYNYFEDKEDLLAHALLAHVAGIMSGAHDLLPRAGTATVAQNLTEFIDHGMDVLARVTPAFAGLLAQPNVLVRFRAMVGGAAAFGAQGDGHAAAGHEAAAWHEAADGGPQGLPQALASYLRAEQELGRVDPRADVAAAVTLLMGAIHGQVLPRFLFRPPGEPAAPPPGLAARLAETVLRGIAPPDD